MATKYSIYGTRVKQLDYETDEVVDLYNSLEEAAEDNFITRKAIQYALINNEGKVRKRFVKFQVIEKKDVSKMKILADGIQPSYVKDAMDDLKAIAIKDGYDVRTVSDDAFSYKGEQGALGFIYYDPYLQAVIEE